MSAQIRTLSYFVLDMNDVPGEGERLLAMLQKYKVDLLAISAFPSGKRSQVDLVPADADRFLAIEERLPWLLSRQKTCFLVQGDNQAGALIPVLKKLGGAGINITSMQAIAADGARFGAILWVKNQDVKRTAELLVAR